MSARRPFAMTAPDQPNNTSAAYARDDFIAAECSQLTLNKGGSFMDLKHELRPHVAP